MGLGGCGLGGREMRMNPKNRRDPVWSHAGLLEGSDLGVAETWFTPGLALTSSADLTATWAAGASVPRRRSRLQARRVRLAVLGKGVGDHLWEGWVSVRQFGPLDLTAELGSEVACVGARRRRRSIRADARVRAGSNR